MDDRYYHAGLFYFNKKDKRVIVPKLNKALGFTVNFARWEAYLAIAIIIVAAILASL